MALRFRPPEEIRWFDEWPFQPSQLFLRSDAFEAFSRELERYVAEEIPGRSFLIAGHRGAGKTTLVQHAVRMISDRILNQNTYAADVQRNRPDAAGPSRIKHPQRPLLVKIHGPSLMTATLPASAGEEKGKPADATQGVKPTEPAHGALVQITTALYRALATEFAHAFTIHAREAYRLGPDDQLELAGQFKLELDKAPNPTVLRAFWRRLRRTAPGILWPRRVGDMLVANGMADQGMREIVALTTAAQAFRVCSGAVKYTQTEVGKAKDEQTRESKGDVSLKDALNKLFAVLAGGAVGVGTAAQEGNSLTFAAVAGVAVALVGAMGLSWSSKRSVSQETTLDHTFIRDYSIQTLDRDLPLVIERIRDAGLAPVFVIDELDKVDKVDEAVKALIGRLKHLTTDFGFFCFLTDRDYYQNLRSKLRAKAFPEEHTYFSRWLFLLYQPREFADHVDDLLESVWTGAGFEQSVDAEARKRDDALAAAILGRRTVLRSKLNTVAAIRHIAESTNGDGLNETNEELRSTPANALAVMFQLAIELMLERADIASRMNDALFAQTAVDVLYRLAYAWDDDLERVDVSREAVVAYLLERQHVVPQPSVPPEQLLSDAVGKIDLPLLVDVLNDLIDLLNDFGRLRTELVTAKAQDPRRIELLKLVPESIGGLLDRVGVDEVAFRYDAFGASWPARRAAASRGRLTDEIVEELQALLPFVTEAKVLTVELDIDLAQLVTHGLLPPSLSLSAADVAATRLAEALRSFQSYEAISTDLTLVRNFVAEFQRCGDLLAAMIPLALKVAHDAARLRETITEVAPVPVEPLAAVIATFGRHLDLREFSEEALHGTMAPVEMLLRHVADLPDSLAPLQTFLLATAADLGDFRTYLLACARRAREAQDPLPSREEAWNRWAEQISAHLKLDIPGDRAPADERAWYGDLVLAAAALLPSTRFRRPLDRMNIADWSEICLAGLPAMGQRSMAPPWTVVAALATLGFGQKFMAGVLRDLGDSSVVAAGEFAQDAPRGILVIGRAGSLIDVAPGPRDLPVFAVTREHAAEYAEQIDWLVEHDAFERYYDERAKVDAKVPAQAAAD